MAIVIGVGLVLVMILLGTGARFTRGTRGVTLWFECPLRKQPVRVEFQVTAWDGRRVDVDCCSAFAPPSAITCDKACLRPGGLRARTTTAAA